MQLDMLRIRNNKRWLKHNPEEKWNLYSLYAFLSAQQSEQYPSQVLVFDNPDFNSNMAPGSYL